MQLRRGHLASLSRHSGLPRDQEHAIDARCEERGRQVPQSSRARPLAAGSLPAPQLRIWELQRSVAGGAPTNSVGKAEKDVGAPVLDVEWRDDGLHVFGVGCGKTVKQWSLQADQTQDIGAVSKGAADGHG